MINPKIAAPQRKPVFTAGRPSNINPKTTCSQTSGKTHRQLVTPKSALTLEKSTPSRQAAPADHQETRGKRNSILWKNSKSTGKQAFFAIVPQRQRKKAARPSPFPLHASISALPRKSFIPTPCCPIHHPSGKTPMRYRSRKQGIYRQLRNAIFRDPKNTRETLMVSFGKIRRWPKFAPVSDTSQLVSDTVERIP
jgi:hypothetical protein